MSLLDKNAKLHHAASTQINVPGGTASKIIEIGRKFIPDEVLIGEGRVETLHVTVKYGVEEDEQKLRAVCASLTPFTITLDRTAVFVASEGGSTPVVVEANAGQLDHLHKAVMDAMGTEADPFPYTPHITIAYVKEIEAQHFAGAEIFAGVSFQATSVVLSKHNDDDQVTVPLGKAMAQTAAAAPGVAPEIPEVSPPEVHQVPQQQDEDVVERDQPATEDEFKDEEAERVLEQQRKDEEWRKRQQQKPPKKRPEHSEYPLPEEEDVRVQEEPRKVTRTKAFKQWFGKSQVVDQNGKPLMVYHGTTHDIQTFDPNVGNVENYYGRGMYFTDSKLDAAANYATDVGPDITSRIERRREELEQQVWDMAPEDLEELFGVKEDGEDLDNAIAEKAREEIVGAHGGATMPVYLSLQNPVYVLKQGGTMFEMTYENEDPEDEDSEMIEGGTAMKLYQAYVDNAYSFGVDGQEGWGAMMEAMGGGEYFSAYDFDQAVRKDDRIEDQDGNHSPGQFLQEIYKDAGFDGIIMDAWTAFGHTKYKNMTMDYDTRHYIIWDPTKVKSAIGNRAYDPKNPNITAAAKPKAVPLPKILHDDGWLTPTGKWIDTSMSEHERVAKQLGFKGKDPRRAAIDAGYTRVTIWEHVQEAIFMFKDSATAHKWMPVLLKHIPVETENVSVEEGKGNYQSYEIADALEAFTGGGIKKTPGMKFDYVPWKPERDTIIASRGMKVWHGTNSKKPYPHEGMYFAQVADDAQDYGKNLYAATIMPKRILKPNSPVQDLNEIYRVIMVDQKGLMLKDIIGDEGVHFTYIDQYPEAQEAARELGYDAIYVDEPMSSDGRSIMVLDPEIVQFHGVKSAASVGDLGLAKKVMHELFPVLGVKLPEPELKVVNQPRAGWLGRDTWQIWLKNGLMGSGDNTTIDIQKSILHDEETLRRVIAHELCHHADSLIEGKEELEKYKNFGRIGYNTFRNGQKGTGHGATWKAYAQKYNAKYGADFVTEKSDETYAQEELPIRPYHIRLWKNPNGKIYYAVSSRIGKKMRKWLDLRAVEPDPSERMTTTDSRLFIHGAIIGNGWSVPQGKDKAEKERLLQQLWDAAPEIKPTPLPVETADELDLMQRMRDWNLTRGRKGSVSKTADYWDGLDQTAMSIISEYRQKAMENPSYRQKWEVAPAARIAKIWTEFTKTGIVHDVKGMDDIAWTVLHNIWKIHVNTILCGHTERDPMEFVESVTGENFEGHDIFNDYDNSYFEDDNGAWRISDYALDDLVSGARRLENAQTAEQKLVAVDQILNVVHARSDLSSWFVQGGRSALTKIFGKGIKSAAVPQIDPLEHGVSKDYDRVRWVYQYFYNNQIQTMTWKDFQKTFQWATNSPLFTQVRQNRPNITMEDLDRWMQEYREKAKEYQNYELEMDRYQNKETSFRDVEQLVLKINQSASAAEIIGEDPMMTFFLGQVAQGSVQSGHPVSANTVGWLRVDFINDQWLLVDEVQSDLINAVDLAKRFITEPTLQTLMDSYRSDTVKQKIRDMGATEAMFQHSKQEFARRGYTVEKLEEMKQSLVNLFKDWAEYGVASLIEIARRQGIQNVAIHTGRSIAKRDPDLEADKAGRYYDQIAKGFGFKKQQLDVGELKGEFWVRTASKTAGKRDEAVTSMSIGVDTLEFPNPVLIRWEQGMRWRQVLKVVKSIAGEVAGNKVPWREIHIWKSLWDNREAQDTGWESEKAKGSRVMFDILHNGSFVSVGAPFGWDAKAEALGATDEIIEASHKTPPLSDTMYNEPELGTETNAYADIPERVRSEYDVPSLSRLMGQRWGSALLKKRASNWVDHIPSLWETVYWNSQQSYDTMNADGLSEIYWDANLNKLPEEEKEAAVRKIIEGMWEQAEGIMLSWNFPLTVYRAVAVNDAGDFKTTGTGVSWAHSEDSEYIEKLVPEAHGGTKIMLLRGEIGPEAINWESTAYHLLVWAEEKEVALQPGAKVKIIAWKYKGENEWRAPDKKHKIVTAEYAEGQAMTQHTDHTPVGLSKTLKSDPFAEELALVHGELGEIMPNPQLDAGGKSEGVPKAKGEEDLEINQGQTMKQGFKGDRRDTVPGQVYLLHFDIDPKATIDPSREDASNPFHARHYLGWAEDAQERIRQHYQGQGARLTQALKERGISFTVARIWEDKDRNFERRLKSQGSLTRHCPICWRMGLIPASRMRGKALENLEAVPDKYQVGPDFAEVQKEASADEVQAVIAEINEKYPANEANPKERMLMSGGKPIAFFEIDDTHKGRLRIRTIRAVEPRQGAGSLALRRITNIADKYGVQIELTASPYGDEETRLGKDDLQNWYRKNNFRDEEGYDPALGYMIRQPKKADNAQELNRSGVKSVGFMQAVMRAGDTFIPTGTCDRCGTGIKNVFVVTYRDGSVQNYGSECINKILSNAPDMKSLFAKNAKKLKRYQDYLTILTGPAEAMPRGSEYYGSGLYFIADSEGKDISLGHWFFHPIFDEEKNADHPRHVEKAEWVARCEKEIQHDIPKLKDEIARLEAFLGRVLFRGMTTKEEPKTSNEKKADTDILIENKGGSVYGDYISVDELPEFGEGMYTSPELQEELKERGHHTVVLMHGIEIDRKQRGKGYGDDLLNKFLEEAKGLPIVLSADTAQRQIEGFSLVDWYQRHGFELTGAGSVFPVMVRW